MTPHPSPPVASTRSLPIVMLYIDNSETVHQDFDAPGDRLGDPMKTRSRSITDRSTAHDRFHKQFPEQPNHATRTGHSNPSHSTITSPNRRTASPNRSRERTGLTYSDPDPPAGRPSTPSAHRNERAHRRSSPTGTRNPIQDTRRGRPPNNSDTCFRESHSASATGQPAARQMHISVHVKWLFTIATSS